MDGAPFYSAPGDGQWARQANDTWFSIWDLAKPVIAQIHGYAIAGGTELASACDLVYVAADAAISYPVVRVMSPPDWQYHTVLLGMRRAMELMLTGDPISGVEAAQIGFANRAFEADVLEESVLRIAVAGRRSAERPDPDQQALRSTGPSTSGGRGPPSGPAPSSRPWPGTPPPPPAFVTTCSRRSRPPPPKGADASALPAAEAAEGLHRGLGQEVGGERPGHHERPVIDRPDHQAVGHFSRRAPGQLASLYRTGQHFPSSSRRGTRNFSRRAAASSGLCLTSWARPSAMSSRRAAIDWEKSTRKARRSPLRVPVSVGCRLRNDRRHGRRHQLLLGGPAPVQGGRGDAGAVDHRRHREAPVAPFAQQLQGGREDGVVGRLAALAAGPDRRRRGGGHVLDVRALGSESFRGRRRSRGRPRPRRRSARPARRAGPSTGSRASPARAGQDRRAR